MTLTKDEEGYTYDPETGKVWHDQGQGKQITHNGEYRIPFGSVFTHFHPQPQKLNRYGISYGDVGAMLYFERSQVRAVYPHGVYRVVNTYPMKRKIKQTVEALERWEVHMQNIGHKVISPVDKYAGTSYFEGAVAIRETADWTVYIGPTIRREFVQDLDSLLGLRLELVPLGVI